MASQTGADGFLASTNLSRHLASADWQVIADQAKPVGPSGPTGSDDEYAEDRAENLVTTEEEE